MDGSRGFCRVREREWRAARARLGGSGAWSLACSVAFVLPVSGLGPVGGHFGLTSCGPVAPVNLC
jgi:hypothetical protein